MRLTYAGAALLGLAPLFAQEGTAPDTNQNRPESAVSKAWRQFQQDHGSWQVEWNAATGTPSAIWGPGLRLAQRRIDELGDARTFAEATLQRYEQLLGRGGSTFVERIGQKVRHVHVFVYDQLWNGLEVISGRADIRIHDVGVLSLLGSRAVAIPANFNPNPAISADAALAIAYREAGATPAAGPLAQQPDVRLVIWADTELTMPTTPRLAWEVRIDAPVQKKEGRSYVDARTGQVLQYRNDLHECFAGCGHDTAATATLDTAALARELRARAKGGFDVHVEYGTPIPGATNVVGTLRGYVNNSLDNRRVPSLPTLSLVGLHNVRVRIPSTNAFAYTSTSGAFDVTHGGTTTVQINIEFTNARRIADVYPASGGGTKIVRNINVTPGVPVTITLLTSTAAEFDQSQTTTYFLTNGIHEYTADLVGANLPGASNAVRATVNVGASCNATYSSGSNLMSFYRQSGTSGSACVNTGYQTVVQHEWGHGLDNWYGGISQTDGLSEGWGDILGTFHSGQPRLGPNFRYNGTDVRSALNTRTYPAGGGVHQQGETWMGWAWDVRTNLIAKYGNTTAGATMAAEIIIPSIVADATNQPNAVREVFLLDDTDGNLGNGTPHCRQLIAACTKRNLPVPAGTACSGSTAPYLVSPAAAVTAEQSSNNTFPFGNSATHSYMQVHGDLRGKAKSITGINFRKDGVTSSGGGPKTITLQMYFGNGNYDTFGNNFLANYIGARTLVRSGTVSMPGWVGAPPSAPTGFSFRIPTTSAYAWAGANDFVWEVRTTAMSATHGMFADAFSGNGDTLAGRYSVYGSGCIATGQRATFTATMVPTTSKKLDRHTLTLGALNARANSSCAYWLGVKAANIPGLCAPIQVDLGGWLYSAGATSDASGDFTLPTLSWGYHPAWIGFTWYGQAIGFDAGQVPFPLILSTGARASMPGPGGTQIIRLYNTGSASATTGSLGIDYGLVIALD